MAAHPEVGTPGTCQRHVYWAGDNVSYPCGQPGTLQRDPFTREIWESEDYVYFCDYHFSERADDI
jgi:hypothetical protein